MGPIGCHTAHVRSGLLQSGWRTVSSSKWAWLATACALILVFAALWVTRDHGPKVKNPLAMCPVAGGIVKDNFGAPRSDHTHYGDDVYADYGTPVRAVFAGVTTNSETTGGLIVTLTAPDGSFMVGKHLSAIEPERSVHKGDVIGYVGQLDVPGTLPHLHFEWHPGGGAAVNPFPYLSEVCPGVWEISASSPPPIP